MTTVLTWIKEEKLAIMNVDPFVTWNYTSHQKLE